MDDFNLGLAAICLVLGVAIYSLFWTLILLALGWRPGRRRRSAISSRL